MPSGTVEATTFSRPTSAASLALAPAPEYAGDVRDPARFDAATTVREHPARLRRLSGTPPCRSASSGIVTGGRPRLTTSSTGRSMPLHRREGGFGDGALKNERTRIVGDAAHHVEPSRAPGTPSARLPPRTRRAPGACRRTRRAQRSRPTSGSSDAWRPSIHPRARSASCSSGSICARMRRVRVPHPRDVGVDAQWRIERLPVRVGDDHAALLRDQRRADVIRVTASAARQPAAREHRTQQRPQIGDEAVVAGRQLVELPTGRGVLILEALRLAGRVWAERAAHDRLVDAPPARRARREKARHRRVTVRDASAPRRPSGGSAPVPRQAVVAMRPHAFAPHRPQLIRQVLLHERDLRLHRRARHPAATCPARDSAPRR